MEKSVGTKKSKGRKRVLALSLVILLLLALFPIIKNLILENEGSYKGFIPSESRQYEKVNLSSADIHKGELVLVNNKTPYKFSENLDLLTVYENKSSNYNVKDAKVAVTKNTMDALNDLLDDFYKKYRNNKINIISGHRTYDFQESLLAARIESQGKAEAVQWVAQPGGSEHHTGLAVDFSIFNRDDGSSEPYDGGGKYKWINKNAYKYGLIVRYEEEKKDITGIADEPWHFRYLGLPHSYLVTEKKFCYEEYVDFLRDYEFGKEHLEIKFKNKSFEVYFTKERDVFVPEGSDYSISGNNVDGFIVTIKN